jgi:hypothetical protein
MGAVTRDTNVSLMTACEIANYLLERCETLGEFESFMFGSSLLGVGNDIDILIVGPSGEPLSRLKMEFQVVASELPLDVLYMLPAEAEITEFVVREGCIPLAQLATPPKMSAQGAGELVPNPAFQRTAFRVR